MERRSIIWSYGGGVQTIAILVLIAKGLLPKPERVIMADTGRERTSTMRYYRQYARPVMKHLGLKLEMASHSLSRVDLYSHKGKILMPVWTQTGKLPTFCSSQWKQYVQRRYMREQGYGPARPIVQWLGMSLDEVGRLSVSDVKWIQNHYPLCFDVPKRRHECELLIADFGLPVPPKSACWGCPLLNNAEWQEIKDDDPADFQRALELDEYLRERDKRGGVYLHRSAVPLADADFTVPAPAADMFDMECANSCWT